uniref:UPAR/Ly6 domain-containing protein n=1 Tax=Timema shepardi TaxID=629360 RepID=A0A7R9G4N8_TIMSH|nr:unnamed protein product [Timema shepardi]
MIYGNEMMSVQLEWILVCLIFAFLHQRSQTSKTNEHQHHKQRWALFEYGTGPEADTESRVTCYTCVNVSDNLVCNKFAIDRPCPLDKDFCHTLHVMDSRGQSVVVNKKCANSSECSPQRVGCVSIDTQKVAEKVLLVDVVLSKLVSLWYVYHVAMRCTAIYLCQQTTALPSIRLQGQTDSGIPTTPQESTKTRRHNGSLGHQSTAYLYNCLLFT